MIWVNKSYYLLVVILGWVNNYLQCSCTEKENLTHVWKEPHWFLARFSINTQVALCSQETFFRWATVPPYTNTHNFPVLCLRLFLGSTLNNILWKLSLLCIISQSELQLICIWSVISTVTCVCLTEPWNVNLSASC